MGDDGSSLRGGGLAEHHELDPLGDAVEKGDETLQDGVIHCATVHHKAVIVLKLQARTSTRPALTANLQIHGIYKAEKI